MTFEIFTHDDGQVSWRLLHDSGRLIAVSPVAATSMEEAMEAIAYVRSSSCAGFATA